MSGKRPLPKKMRGLVLPGKSNVEIREFPVPEPGPGQVLLAMRASTICGSDIRAIYRSHEGHGPEGYQGVIAGHEPCGRIAKTGPGCRRFKEGDRVIVYHISGCGLCHDCQMGYQISCSGPQRAAYGWQRDGGHADFMLAEERDLINLPDSLSFTAGAQVACGFGTCFEALSRIGVSGGDAVLVVGLGPVGLAAAMLAKAMGAWRVVGVEKVKERMDLAKTKKIADVVLPFGPGSLDSIREAVGDAGVGAAVDCSGDSEGRRLAIKAARSWGRVALVGEGGSVAFEPSPDMLHKHLTMIGSWVTSLGRMQELAGLLARWGLNPDRSLTHRFPLERAAEAYSLMDEGRCGKVAIVWDD